MRPTVYLETSIISYLVALPSRDLITAARQQVTYEWWSRRRSSFDLFVSQLVIDEASAGDPEAAARHLPRISPITCSVMWAFPLVLGLMLFTLLWQQPRGWTIS